MSACLVPDNIGQRDSIMAAGKRRIYLFFYSRCGYLPACLPASVLFSKLCNTSYWLRGLAVQLYFVSSFTSHVDSSVACLMGHTHCALYLESERWVIDLGIWCDTSLLQTLLRSSHSLSLCLSLALSRTHGHVRARKYILSGWHSEFCINL